MPTRSQPAGAATASVDTGIAAARPVARESSLADRLSKEESPFKKVLAPESSPIPYRVLHQRCRDRRRVQSFFVRPPLVPLRL